MLFVGPVCPAATMLATIGWRWQIWGINALPWPSPQPQIVKLYFGEHQFHQFSNLLIHQPTQKLSIARFRAALCYWEWSMDLPVSLFHGLAGAIDGAINVALQSPTLQSWAPVTSLATCITTLLLLETAPAILCPPSHPTHSLLLNIHHRSDRQSTQTTPSLYIPSFNLIIHLFYVTFLTSAIYQIYISSTYLICLVSVAQIWSTVALSIFSSV